MGACCEKDNSAAARPQAGVPSRYKNQKKADNPIGHARGVGFEQDPETLELKKVKHKFPQDPEKAKEEQNKDGVSLGKAALLNTQAAQDNYDDPIVNHNPGVKKQQEAYGGASFQD